MQIRFFKSVGWDHSMTLFEKLLIIYPELTEASFNPMGGCVKLQDDSDGKGSYIAKWVYDKPKPTQEQLDSLD